MTKRRAIIGPIFGYFLVTFVGLFFYISDSPFCSAPPIHLLQTLRLTIACTAWAVIVCVCGRYIANSVGRPGLTLVLIGCFALLGFGSIPFWIYEGYGTFLFKGTRADVSCFFTEAWGMVFSFLVAPALTFETLLGYGSMWLMLKASDQGESSTCTAQQAG